MSDETRKSIQVNDERRSVAANTTLREIVEAVVGRSLGADGSPTDGGRLGVAAAVSGTVVPRSRWHETSLPEGAQVDVVTAAQGG